MMKKILCVALALVMLCGFAACGSKKEEPVKQEKKADIVFNETNYVTLINDVYNNPDNYIGKTVQIDGMFTSEDYTSNGGKIYYYVYRQGPGCCGNDGSMCGFEFSSKAAPTPITPPRAGTITQPTRGLRWSAPLNSIMRAKPDPTTHSKMPLMKL